MSLLNFVPPVTEPKSPFGYQKTELPYNQVFWDAFEGGASIDTTNRWTTSTAGGGTVTQTTGTLTVTSGTTANGFGLVQTIPTFLPRNPAFMIEQGQIQLEAAPFILNTYRFWGFGSFPGSPTLASPVTNGVGWEINTDGRLRAVIFASGGRTVIADLGVGLSAGILGTGAQVRVSDGSTHMFVIYFRGDRIVWCMDNYDSVVASVVTGAQGPDINTIGWGALSLPATGATTSAAINLAQVTLSETAHNAFQISDGPFPFRRVTVNASGQISTTATPAAGITPTDRTITSLSGSSQQLMAANAARHSLTVQNTGNANIGVNPTGGTAVIGGAGTLTLAPLGSYTPAIPTLSAVTVIGTAGQPAYANES